MSIVGLADHLPAPAAFPVWQKEPVFGLRAEDTLAGDWFVLAHLGFFFFLFACFGWAAWNIWRRTCCPPPHVQLLMELEETAAKASLNGARASSHEAKPETPPWERPDDWWKRG